MFDYYSKTYGTVVEQMLYGPYKKKWLDKNGIMDNSDVAIAKELDIDVHIVARLTRSITKKRHKQFLKNLNNKKI